MTQKQQVLQILRDAGDRGAHSFEFLTAGMPRVAARVGELRAEGHTITSTPETLHGDAKGVRYRLVEPVQVPLVVESLDDQFDRLFPPAPSNGRPHWQQDAAA
jgi:hypothetical protein